MAAPRGVSPLPDRSASEPCPVSEDELAALKAEITQLRRQASLPPSLLEAVLREAALRERCCLTALPEDLLQHIVDFIDPLAFHIARAAPTCKVISVAVCNALKARPFSSEVVTLDENDAVLGVAAAPDGRVITGSEETYDDNTVTVWRERTVKISGRIIKVWNERTIEAHTEEVRAVAVLTPPQGGARFVSVSEDRSHPLLPGGLAKLFTFGGELERDFNMDHDVHCVAALPDGVHFVVGLGGSYFFGDVRLYHVDGTLVHTFEARDDNWEEDDFDGLFEVQAVAVTPDGQHIISGSSDSLVKVWSVASKSLVSTCAGHTEEVLAVAAMPDGQRILSGSDDKTVRVWLLNGTLENTFELHTRSVNALVALPDNQHALSCSWDHTVKLFNVNDGAVVRTFTHHTGGVRCLALLPDGLRFVSGSNDNTARIAYHGLALQ